MQLYSYSQVTANDNNGRMTNEI